MQEINVAEEEKEKKKVIIIRKSKGLPLITITNTIDFLTKQWKNFIIRRKSIGHRKVERPDSNAILVFTKV